MMSNEYSGMKIQTAELLALLATNKKHVIEASLTNGTLTFTHFIDFGGRIIFDMGIDSQEVSWKPNEFLKFYKDALWQIDQIV